MCSSSLSHDSLFLSLNPQKTSSNPLCPGSLGLKDYLKHLLLDGPQSAAVYLSITHLLTQGLNAEDPCPRFIITHTQNHKLLVHFLICKETISIILCIAYYILYFTNDKKIIDPGKAIFYSAPKGTYFNAFAFSHKLLCSPENVLAEVLKYSFSIRKVTNWVLLLQFSLSQNLLIYKC